MEQPFNVDYKGVNVIVQQIGSGVNRIFNITFPDTRKSLVITVAIKPDDTKWWTSIPQGRQKEAEEIGKLIATYIRSKRKEQK